MNITGVIALFVAIVGICMFVLGVLTAMKKFDPLLREEKKKLPPKARGGARKLNAFSMLVCGALICLLALGVFLENQNIINASGFLVVLAMVICLNSAAEIEGKYFEQKKKK